MASSPYQVQETLTAAGAITPQGGITYLDSTAGVMAMTLAVPLQDGQRKVITMTADGGDTTVAVTNIHNIATSLTFAAVGDTVYLEGQGGVWHSIVESGAVAV